MEGFERLTPAWAGCPSAQTTSVRLTPLDLLRWSGLSGIVGHELFERLVRVKRGGPRAFCDRPLRPVGRGHRIRTADSAGERSSQARQPAVSTAQPAKRGCTFKH
jgi:hypothetical protein